MPRKENHKETMPKHCQNAFAAFDDKATQRSRTFATERKRAKEFIKSSVPGPTPEIFEGCSNSLNDLDMFRKKRRRHSANQSSTWNAKYAPQNASDLAVHPKKVEEVKTWLHRFSNSNAYTNAPHELSKYILLL